MRASRDDATVLFALETHNAELGLIPHCHQMPSFVIAGKPVRGRVACPLRRPILPRPSLVFLVKIIDPHSCVIVLISLVIPLCPPESD